MAEVDPCYQHDSFTDTCADCLAGPPAPTTTAEEIVKELRVIGYRAHCGIGAHGNFVVIKGMHDKQRYLLQGLIEGRTVQTVPLEILRTDRYTLLLKIPHEQ